MKLQSSLRVMPREVAVKPKSAASFWDEVNELFGKIEKRAFELFEWRGRKDGRDLEDWFTAEHELLKPMRVEMTEKDNMLVVRAEVPGFKADELEISLEPGLLTIKGKQETETKKEVGKTIYRESQSNEIFRKMPLPFNVDADAGKASLQDGVLEIKAPRAEEKKKIEIAAA